MSKGQCDMVTDSLTWKQLVLAKLDPEDAVANGKVVISEELRKLLFFHGAF